LYVKQNFREEKNFALPMRGCFVVFSAALLLHLANAESALDSLDFLLSERVLGILPSLHGSFAHESRFFQQLALLRSILRMMMLHPTTRVRKFFPLCFCAATGMRCGMQARLAFGN
jgi:hypothetical protein